MNPWILATLHIVTTAAFAKHEMYPEALDLTYSTNWIDVVSFDLTKGDDCPEQWSKTTLTSGVAMCGDPTGKSGCARAIFNVGGRVYNKTAGMVRGYQKGTTDGFQASQEDGLGINEAYVDGVSITIGYPRRKHVWTYAAGLTSNGDKPKANCPCSVTRGPDPPTFVGEHYYCQSGSEGMPNSGTYYMLPLWTRLGCTDNCCANAGSPWFYRQFPAPQHEDIEVSICRNQALSDEGVFIDKLRISIYVAPE